MSQVLIPDFKLCCHKCAYVLLIYYTSSVLLKVTCLSLVQQFVAIKRYQTYFFLYQKETGHFYWDGDRKYHGVILVI